MITQVFPLLNAGSKTMNVNGSSVNKNFSFAATGYMEAISLSVILKDDGDTSLNKFGAITALTNGIVISTTQSATTRTIATVKDNMDLVNTFSDDQHFGNSATLSILGVVTPEGFGSSTNIFKGKIDFPKPIPLNNGDTIDSLIQDDLSGIINLAISVITESD